jgi:hypothetical protein
MAIRTVSDHPVIIGDDNSGQLTFTFNGVNYAIGNTEPASWLETLKYAHRNGKNVTITDDDNVTKYSFNGAGTFIPTDLHDS